jgi:hypothetical protein
MTCRPFASTPVERCVDLFASGGHLDEQLHPAFRSLRDSPLLAPARALLNSLRRVSAMADDPWLERFRTAGFEDCMFEIYLTEMLTAAGHAVEALHSSSRLLLMKNGLCAIVDPMGAGQSGRATFERKLSERAWTLDPCTDKSYVLAAECSALGHSTLAADLFAMPGAANVSALLLCGDSGTACKFNRLAQEGAHRSDAVRMLRYGTCRSRPGHGASVAEAFAYEVGKRASGPERWNEETVLLHNPHAVRPLPRGWLGAATEEESIDSAVHVSGTDGFVPLASVTEMLPGDTPTWWVEDRARVLASEAASRARS